MSNPNEFELQFQIVPYPRHIDKFHSLGIVRSDYELKHVLLPKVVRITPINEHHVFTLFRINMQNVGIYSI